MLHWIRANWARTVRVLLGVTLIGLGLGSEGGATGILLAVIGLIPLAAGILGWCPSSPPPRPPEDESEISMRSDGGDG